MIRAVAVVIPARDEAERVLACLRSVLASVPDGIPTVIVLVADRCADDTAILARGMPGVAVIEVEHGIVGSARRDGVRAALALLPGVEPEAIWIAHTDADSAVPPHWLSTQLRLAAEGVDVVIGTVRPDFAELPDGYERAWLTTHRPGEPNGHVHGANLGVRASAYLAAGGFSSDAEHEDTRLVDRLVLAGARAEATDAAEVVTSGRREGRTPGGYAGYLRSELDALASTVAAQEP